jgi:hypothetical protein
MRACMFCAAFTWGFSCGQSAASILAANWGCNSFWGGT